MKKETKLIILLGVLLICVVAYRLIVYINTNQEEVKKNALFDLDKDSITYLDWSYEGVNYAIEKNNGVWHWTNDNKFPVNQDTAFDMADKFATLSASNEISAENIAEYGFNEAAQTICARDNDGKEYKVTVGGRIDLTGENYITVDGMDSVYTVGADFAIAFDKAIDKLLKKESIDAIENYSKIRIVNDDVIVEIVKNDDDKWILGDTVLDELKVSSLASSFFGLTWNACEDYNADAAKKAECGFDKPSAVVSISSDADELKILFGKEENDMLYAKLDGSNMIYTVSTDIWDKLNVSLDELLPEPEQAENTENTEDTE